MQSGKKDSEHPTTRGNNGFISHETKKLVSDAATTIENFAGAGATLVKAGVAYAATNAPGAIQGGADAVDASVKKHGPYALRWFMDRVRGVQASVNEVLAEGTKYTGKAQDYFWESTKVKPGDPEIELSKLKTTKHTRALSLEGRGQYYRNNKTPGAGIVRERGGSL